MFKFSKWGPMEARFLDENDRNEFELQQCKYVRELSGGLFTSC